MNFVKALFIACHTVFGSFPHPSKRRNCPSKEEAPHKEALLATEEPKQLRTPGKQKSPSPCWAAGSRTHRTRRCCSSHWAGSCHSCTASCWPRSHCSSHSPAGPSSHRCSLENSNQSYNWQGTPAVRITFLQNRLVYYLADYDPPQSYVAILEMESSVSNSLVLSAQLFYPTPICAVYSL